MKEIKIVYEDDYLMLLNKGEGVVSTAENYKGDRQTVESWVRQSFEWSRDLKRAGLVHRLDKVTRGLLLVAKNEDVLDSLKKLFKQRKVKKKYMALLEGEVVTKGEIKVPIARSSYSFGKWAVNPDGKVAWTIFRLLKKYRKDGKSYSLVEVDLKTGRTHQIRVHFSYVGWPVAGDGLYGSRLRWKEGIFLQAFYLELEHPIDKKLMSWSIDMDNELGGFLEELDEE
ncbi:RluA family pseudouridine synthase [Candidatus Shapirobacteria bacterium]|nr:MAG: RluA family pseudouridine synthase [Candidatus Shapirobacteria bacterium]